MQPQGLEALMQSQPAPQMNNPRLAAAMDVVSSDAEEQILDPRTLAMLKYKDALQAMQAADQMMASAQPAPTAPTVAERTKLAAEQGIAGLAQRLSPGVQQRGGQMAAQQAQQAMQGGGLPQLSAPNMAGMASGGIVGYADGGAPTPTKVVPRPVPMGQPNVGAQAAVSDDVARYIYNYTNLRSSMEAATDPQQKAVINQRLQEMQRTFSPDIVSEAHMKMSQQSGMAGGGIVAFQKGGMPEAFPSRNGIAQRPTPTLPFPVPGREDFDAAYADAVARRGSELVDAGVPPETARVIAIAEAFPSRNGIAQRPTPTLPFPVPGREDFDAAYADAVARRESELVDAGVPPETARVIAIAEARPSRNGVAQRPTPTLPSPVPGREDLAAQLEDAVARRESAQEGPIPRAPSPASEPARRFGYMTDAEIESMLNTPRSGKGQAIFDTAEYIQENPVDAGLMALTASGLGAPLGVAGTALTRALPMMYRGAKAAMTPAGRAVIGGGGLALSNMFGGEGDEPAAATPTAQQPSMFGVGIDSQRAQPEFRMRGVDQRPDRNVGVAAPTAARAAASNAAPAAAPTNTAESQLRARVEGTVGSTDAGSRYRELTGMEDAIRERRVEQDRLRALQEARFSPEQERSRLLRAGLAGLASRGFGGFSSGIAGEEEIIAGERDTAQQRVIADMDKTINELRALGIGQFEAEQAAAEIHSNELRALAALDQDTARLKQEMTIEEMRQTLTREGLSAERTAALEAAVNEAAVRNSMTPQQVLTIAQRIVADDLTGTKTLAAAVQEVLNAAGGTASPVDAETQSLLDQYSTP